MIALELLRRERKLSRSELAEQAGVHFRTILRLEETEEAGAYAPLEKLGEFFDVEPRELLKPVGVVETNA